MLKPLLNIDYKHHDTSFFFNALFTATTFAIIFVFNTELDRYLEKQTYFAGKQHIYVRLTFHAVTICIVTLIVTYFFNSVFGWGNTLLG